MSNPLTIGQVAAATGLTTHTLRYYERAGLLHAVGRTAAGHRLYSPADLDWLEFVMRLKATGMPIVGMQAFARLREAGTATFEPRRDMLVAHRDAVLARIAELQTNLAAITDKIDWYETAMRPGSTPELQPAERHDGSSQSQRQEQDSP
jgi:DNA-binding transcriptional MerR regulator